MDGTRIRTLAAESGDENPLASLRAITELRRELERAESAAVRRARNAGFSWQHIAGALDVTRQAVHRKHGRR